MDRRSVSARLCGDDRGFSMIELMIVVLIVGILIAVALPTYLGGRARAADRAIQSDLRTGLAAAITYYSEAQEWDLFDAAQALSEEPHLAWVDGGPSARGEIGIVVHAGQNLLLVGLSSSDTYFCVAQLATNPATAKGRGAAFADVNTMAACTGGW